jgi:elongation factor P
VTRTAADTDPPRAFLLDATAMHAKEIKPGTVVNYQGAPMLIELVHVQSPSARGAATLYKFRARNLVTKQKTDITLKGTESLDQADFTRRSVKLMYADATHMHFLDQSDYNEWSISHEDLGNARVYITEELEGMLAMIYNNECVGIQLPTAVELTVTECEPAARGNSATGRNKPATLQTGLVIQVPEYIAEGERVKVDTRTGEYLSRA